MFKGTMSITTDLNTVQNMLGSHRIVIIGEPDPQLVQMTNAVVGSVLLPPYQAMMALMDNDYNNFNMIYYNHLSTQECLSFVSVLVKSMIQGTSLLLYMKPDEYNMYYNAFELYLLNTFGIQIGSTSKPFMYNNNYDPVIYSLLYMNDLITIQELFLIYPAGVQFNDNVVMKLINEMRPVIQDTSFESYRNYFYNYKESIKQTNTYTPNLFVKRI